MYKIQEAEMLANNIYRMVVEAPFVITIEKQELSPSYSCRSENLPKK